jgi:hypothetical protein
MKKLTVVLTILTALVAGTTAASAQTVAQLYGSWKMTSQNAVTATVHEVWGPPVVRESADAQEEGVDVVPGSASFHTHSFTLPAMS